jgi:hypothetical protein
LRTAIAYSATHPHPPPTARPLPTAHCPPAARPLPARRPPAARPPPTRRLPAARPPPAPSTVATTHQQATLFQICKIIAINCEFLVRQIVKVRKCINFASKLMITMIYLITYDLNTEGKDYNALYDKIKSLGECFHPLESVWFLQPFHYSDVNTVTEQLRTTMDSNDNIFVVEITDKSRQGWLPKTAWDWLKAHK